MQLEERQISGEEKGEGLLLTSRTNVQDVEGGAHPHLTPETSNEKNKILTKLQWVPTAYPAWRGQDLRPL